MPVFGGGGGGFKLWHKEGGVGGLPFSTFI